MPFDGLPDLCHKQLRGADPEHWEALLRYLEAGGVGDSPPPRQAEACHPLSKSAARECSGNTSDRDDPAPAGGNSECSTGAAAAMPITEAAQVARADSAPTLGLIRTAIEGRSDVREYAYCACLHFGEDHHLVQKNMDHSRRISR